MIDTSTRQQIAELDIDASRPLFICDVDEVVVHFISAFEDYLAGTGLWLDAASFALNGNIRRISCGTPISTLELGEHLRQFFQSSVRNLRPIEGASAALAEIADKANVVMLTNLPEHFREDRAANLHAHGMRYPIITNSGPKGPAVAEIAKSLEGAIAFIDDNPGYLASVAESCPRVRLVHFMQDERFSRFVKPEPGIGLYARCWTEALPHVKNELGIHP